MRRGWLRSIRRQALQPMLEGAFCPIPLLGKGTGYGNAGAGVVRGPDQNNIDLSITKALKMAEQHALEFRSEFFNSLNHVQYSTPGPLSLRQYGRGSAHEGAFEQRPTLDARWQYEQ
jgi:hypothetical protein